MSLTRAVHTRFWKSMGERFGKRWLDDYGNEPTKSWKDLLDRFTPDDLAEALARLKDRPEHSRSHPPTHGEFETLLIGAARRNNRPSENFRRGYWRSIIVGAAAATTQQLGFISRFAEFEQFLIEHKVSMGERLRALLDEVENAEISTGQRTLGMETHAANRAAEIAAKWSPRPQLEIVR